MELTVLPFALLGVLVGIIFVSDGWFSSRDPNPSLSKSPKIRGLIYILGAGIIPLVTDLSEKSGTNAPSSISTYTLFFTSSVLFSLFLLSLYAFLVGFKRLRRIYRRESFLEIAIESLVLVSIAIQEGSRRFQEEINNKLIQKNNEQTDTVIEFMGAIIHDMVKLANKREKNCERFDEFIKSYLEKFIEMFLYESEATGSYRACIYYLAQNKNELQFFTGFHPPTAPHTKEELPLRESLAGYALNNPYVAHFRVISQRESNIPFHSRRIPGRYKSVVVCAMQSIFNEINFPKMVLCIDCVDSRIQSFGDYEYVAKMIVLLSIVFAYAQVLMEISDTVIEEYIQH